MASQDAASSHYGDTAGPAKAADTEADEDGEEHHDGGNGNGNGDGNGHDNPNNPHTAPEVDAALAAGGLAMIGGTLMVLRARRRK